MSENSVSFFTATTLAVFGNEKPLTPKVFSWIDRAPSINQVLSSIFTLHIELRKVHLNRDGTEKKILKVLKPLGLGRRVPAEVNCKP